MAKKNGSGSPAPRAARVRLMKRFEFPRGCDIQTAVLRELDGNDDEQVSILADARADGVQRQSVMLMSQIEQREALRMSLVEVDGDPVNADGVPWGGLDDLSMRTLRLLQVAFAEVNGVTGDEAEGFKKAAVVVTSSDAAETIAPVAPRSIAASGG